MTRETRIGLLVAMGFILTFGMVLSELTGKPSPAGMRIRTAMDYARRSGFSPIIERTPVEDPTPAPPNEVAAADAVSKSVALSAEREAVVRVDLLTPDSVGPVGSGQSTSRLLRRTAAKPNTYTVKPGDSLCRIAYNVYGDESRYKEIFEANRDILTDETVVPVGEELMIPGRQAATAYVQQNGFTQSTPGEDLPVVPPAQTEKPYKVMDIDQLARHFRSVDNTTEKKPSGRIYVVRSGDNLTRIARKELNDDSHRAAMKIFEANRDKLESPDHLMVGMELQIPI